MIKVLIIGLGLFLALSISRGGSATNRAFRRLFAVLLVAAMTTMALAPDATSAIAEKLGVGRGADLLLYLLLIYAVFLSVLLFREVASLRAKVALLVSEVALLEGTIRPPDAETM